ncbi:MAG: GAF domain-containing protein, partial [Bacteroidia bacterium]|nr:GAF domain-containing protein [Bacteroidia bacterium]
SILEINKLARTFTAILPAFLCSILHAYIVPAGLQPLPGFLIMETGLAMLPFALFRLKNEKYFLILALLLAVVPIIVYNRLNQWLEIEYPEIYRYYYSKIFSYILVFAGLFTTIVTVSLIIYNNFLSEKRNDELLLEIEQSYKKIKFSEAELATTIKKFEESQILENQRKIEDEKRNWTTQGLAKFADLLRKESTDFKGFAYVIISSIVDYVKANQGGLFLINDENKNERYIELIASCAYNRRKYIEKRVEWGEGIIGQCILEKESVYMTDIPEDYIHITSGLGTANPKNLIIVPLKLTDQIFGAVEIASFNKFESYQIKFIEQVGESIASTISNVKINMRTAALLEQSRQQAEEMRSQEEEMRQNMEELLATQEEMTRKEAEMKNDLAQLKLEIDNFHIAVNNTFFVIEYDMQGIFLTADENFLLQTGCSIAQLLEKNHKDFSSEKEIQSKEYADFWQKLNNGLVQEGEFLHIFSGKEIWLHETYTPVKNKSGEYFKVIVIGNKIDKLINV